MPSEATVIARVRPVVVERDGPCRIARNLTLGFLGACGGPSEWAHVGSHRRFKTRKMEPEVRHTSAGTVMLCGAHHDAYDAHQFQIEELTDAGCDGPLAFTKGGIRFAELP